MCGMRLIFTVSVLVAVGTAVFAWKIRGAKPRVSATVVGYTTNQAEPQMAKDIGSSTYVCAVVAVTNNSKRVLTYKGFGFDGMSPQLAVYSVLRETDSGWKSLMTCETGPQEYALRPGECFKFEAFVVTKWRSKVAFTYNDGCKPSWIARRLPVWLSAKLPWLSPWHTVTTEPIDLRPRN